MRKIKEIESSLIKKYRKYLWARFVKGSIDYNLIEENDRIAVCISGGKDSLMLAKMMQELYKHGPIKFDLEFICMDPGFSEENRQLIIDNCRDLEIPVKIKRSEIFKIANKLAPDSPCYMCARMRRGFLYEFAQEVNCNKIALGHHFNDIIETTMLNIIYAGNFKTMVPKLPSDNFENMTLIRPMVLVREKDIIRFMEYNGIQNMGCGCDVASGVISSKRVEVRELIANLKDNFKDADISIFKAAENVNIDSVMGYQKGKEKFSMEDIYQSRKKHK